MAYLPIQDYGLIGNMHTVALVGKNASIDWYCSPRFDSPSLFGRILDDKKGGHFRIRPRRESMTTKQFYWPDSNVLVTRFLSPDGVADVTDFMPAGLPPGDPARHQIVRLVKGIRGKVALRMECLPAFNYARDSHEIQLSGETAHFVSGEDRVALAASVPLKNDGASVVAFFDVAEGETVSFSLGPVGHADDMESLAGPREAGDLMKATVRFWRHWLGRCTYQGRWREMVYRSALVLKLLTYEPTGAVVAAPTCSLPARVGGDRNWDYRYTWIRDAAFTIYGLLRVGFTEEAAAFMSWLDDRCHELGPGGTLQVMYGIDGRHDLAEEVLDHLDGYRGSRPVRIGNGAHKQLQLDIYGELMDSVYLYNKYGSPISYDLWKHLRRLTDWVASNWQQKDESIWEVRGGRQDFVYSRLMCWVALDRALRLADKRSFPADRARWMAERDRIYEEIMERGWNAERNAFVQHYGSRTLDASTLIMSLVFFLSPSDPRNLGTLEAIYRSPEKGGLVSNSLVHRYHVDETDDGVGGSEGTFNLCTFWLVEALTRAGWRNKRRLEQARLAFEQMLGHANHLGLYAEETGPSGEALGNFPQAFTHFALISAAFNLDRALGRRD